MESDLTANDIFGAVLEDAEKKRLKKEIKDLKDNISQLRNEKQFPDIEELPNKEKGTSHPITPQDRNKSGDLNKPRLHIDRRKARLTERSNYQEKSELRTMLASIDYKTMGVCLIILIIFCIVGSC